MVQAPQRTAISGPALIRLLARLANADVAEPAGALSDRLSQWLGWTDAIALSTALDSKPAAVAAGSRNVGNIGNGEDALCAQVRAALTRAIAGDAVRADARRAGPHAGAAASVETPGAQDASAWTELRQRYLSLQQTMESDIGNLRGRLRALLATRTPAMARLAVVDAIMERSLGARERSLLASVPGLLGAHFERLRAAAAQADAADAADAAPTSSSARATWLDTFRKDMQGVLLAELEVRFQPVEGLLAALRAQ